MKELLFPGVIMPAMLLLGMTVGSRALGILLLAPVLAVDDRTIYSFFRFFCRACRCCTWSSIELDRVFQCDSMHEFDRSLRSPDLPEADLSEFSGLLFKPVCSLRKVVNKPGELATTQCTLIKVV